MKILILGSEGFIGSHCISWFTDRKQQVVGVDLFEQPSRPYRYIKSARLLPDFDEILGNGFDAIINCAGNGNVPYSMTHPLVDFESNCLDTIRILEAIRRQAPSCKYLHLSSAAVYGNPRGLPIREEDELHPVSPYGWHKLMAENLCREYAGLFGLSVAIARPFSVYGPGLRKQMFWDWYRKAGGWDATGTPTKSGASAQPGASIEILGTGKESRDYIYVKDLVLALDLILQKGKLNAEVYNLASGKETTIDEAARLFFPGIGRPVQYSYTGIVREGDPLNWRADIRQLEGLGYAARYTMQEGIAELHEWLKSQKDK